MKDDVPPLAITLADEAATERLGADLAEILRPGDTVLFEGPIGAGKTHLARAVIQAKLGRAEDVPSPTFTLVQVYEADDAEIWHADLYRLTHPDEVLELGLDAAFDTAICLIEWPERLGKHIPANALHLHMQPLSLGRRALISGTIRHRELLLGLCKRWAT